jgi:hypothetical protein
MFYMRLLMRPLLIIQEPVIWSNYKLLRNCLHTSSSSFILYNHVHSILRTYTGGDDDVERRDALESPREIHALAPMYNIRVDILLIILPSEPPYMHTSSSISPLLWMSHSHYMHLPYWCSLYLCRIQILACYDIKTPGTLSFTMKLTLSKTNLWAYYVSTLLLPPLCYDLLHGYTWKGNDEDITGDSYSSLFVRFMCVVLMHSIWRI